MPRTIAIGDIHGCATALKPLIDAFDPQPEDTVVTLGDYVDRGMESAGVIEILLELVSRTQLVPLIGNHEVMLMQAFNNRDAMNFWLQHGGQQTLQSYGGSLEQIPPHHRMFFQHCRRYWENDRHFFIHANYRSSLPLDQIPDEVGLWEHMKLAFPIPHENGKKAWVGHTPQEEGEILDLGHLAIIDTNCYGGGYLSAVDVDSGEYWQVSMDGSFRGE